MLIPNCSKVSAIFIAAVSSIVDKALRYDLKEYIGLVILLLIVSRCVVLFEIRSSVVASLFLTDSKLFLRILLKAASSGAFVKRLYSLAV